MHDRCERIPAQETNTFQSLALCNMLCTSNVNLQSQPAETHINPTKSTVTKSTVTKPTVTKLAVTESTVTKPTVAKAPARLKKNRSVLEYESSTEDNAAPQWSWICKDYRCVRLLASETTTLQSLATCNMLCASTQLWPQPTGTVSLSTAAVPVRANSFSLLIAASPSAAVTEHLKEAFALTKEDMKHLERNVKTSARGDIGIPRPVRVRVAVCGSGDPRLRLDTDESYQLSLGAYRHELIANITAKTFCGARHAFETLSQLIWADPYAGSLLILKSVLIEDAPRFKYRGFLLDTARNYFPVQELLRTIDAMGANKLNTFHWHASDSQAFPLQLDSVPQLAANGAYGAGTVYTTDDIRVVVRRARLRGIRVLLEIDTPSHVGRAWSFGPSAGLGHLVNCIEPEPWSDYCQLNPKNPHVYFLLEKIYAEIIKLTGVDDIFHLGGDEVSEKCWWQHFNESDPMDLWIEFTRRAYRALRKANGGKAPELTLLWSSKLTTSPYLERINLKHIGVQVWGGSRLPESRAVLDAGFRTVISHTDAWYLDCGFGSWKDNGNGHCGPYRSWQQVYEHRPWSEEGEGEGVLSSGEQALPWRIEGGAACQWSEQLGPEGLDMRVWPRLSALAERVWSDRGARAEADVYLRLDTQRSRMVARGVNVAPLWPRWCTENPHACLEMSRVGIIPGIHLPKAPVENPDARDFTGGRKPPQWSWICKNDRCEATLASDTNTLQSLALCSMLCAPRVTLQIVQAQPTDPPTTTTKSPTTTKAPVTKARLTWLKKKRTLLENESSKKDHKPPQWSWICKGDRCVRLLASETNTTLQSLATCNMLCASTQLWPQPTGPVSLSMAAVPVRVASFSLQIIASPSDVVTEHLKDAFALTKEDMRCLEQNVRTSARRGNKGLPRPVRVRVAVYGSGDPRMRLDTDESYKLSLGAYRGEFIANITAHSFCGARHAFETLSQLAWADPYAGSLLILTSAVIVDAPRFKYRGFTLDTARNYFPVQQLLRTIDAMGANKLNTFHWHASDSQAFPLQLDRAPQLAAHGAYGPDAVYTTDDIRAVVRRARLRGIRVLLEVDTPAHVGRAWSFGPSAGLGHLAYCTEAAPWNLYCGEPPCGQLNPKNPHVYYLLEKIYAEIINLTGVDDIFHLGGDEVSEGCWALHFNKSDPMELWIEFTRRAYIALKKANGGKAPELTLLWSSKLTTFPYLERINKKHIGVQVWDRSSSYETRRVIEAGFRTVISHMDAWYLDCGFGSWTGSGGGHCAYRSWQQVYEHKPWAHSRLDEGVSSTEEKVSPPRIEGGAACQWSEQLGPGGLDARVWPRLSALAERLWSDGGVATVADVYLRLDTQRSRMVARGVNAAPLWPRWCSENPNACLDIEDFTAAEYASNEISD